MKIVLPNRSVVRTPPSPLSSIEATFFSMVLSP